MKYYQICQGDDAGDFRQPIEGIELEVAYESKILEPLKFLPGKKVFGDYVGYSSRHDIFSSRVITKFGDLLKKFGELFEITSIESTEKFYLFKSKIIPSIDLVHSKYLKSASNTDHVIGFFEIKYFPEIKSDEIFHPGIPGGACRTLYSEEFIKALADLDAKGYYLLEWSEGPKTRTWLNRNFTQMGIKDSKRTMRKI